MSWGLTIVVTFRWCASGSPTLTRWTAWWRRLAASTSNGLYRRSTSQSMVTAKHRQTHSSDSGPCSTTQMYVGHTQIRIRSCDSQGLVLHVLLSCSAFTLLVRHPWIWISDRPRAEQAKRLNCLKTSTGKVTKQLYPGDRFKFRALKLVPSCEHKTLFHFFTVCLKELS